MKKQFYLFILLSIFFVSCSLEYKYFYLTYLDNSEDKTLAYQDSILKFSFYPQPNGIYFEIQNLSNENIFLLWDGSYFIDPSNNSSKALNTDILSTENKIVSKENYESIIPKKGTFRRFTTSAKNLSYFQKIDVSTYTISPTYTLQNTNYEERYLPNSYWITSSKIPYDGTKEDFRIKHGNEMKKMNEFLKLNNNLGLGFTFRKGEKKLDYDFKIKIDKVIVKLIQNGKIDIDTLRVFK
jgi:hypothetical protein